MITKMIQFLENSKHIRCPYTRKFLFVGSIPNPSLYVDYRHNLIVNIFRMFRKMH